MRHKFVEFIPEKIEDDVLYISIEYATATHNCCCGCGNEVVTPITPTDWKLIFDGETVSLTPSIGNWGFECRSHYWIKNNEIQWAESWTQTEVISGRVEDKNKKDKYYRSINSESNADSPNGLWRKIKRFFN